MLSFINYDFYRHGVEDILIKTLLEKIERAIRDIDNGWLWSRAQKPRVAEVVVMVWYQMFISDPIVTSTRKTNRNILDFKYFFLPCHVPCFPSSLSEEWVGVE